MKYAAERRGKSARLPVRAPKALPEEGGLRLSMTEMRPF
jgi:hypothetical protein